MPRDGAVTLADLRAHGLEKLLVDCTVCQRAGRYDVLGAIERWGAGGKLPDVLASLTDDCPKGKGAAVFDRCGARFPMLSSL